ncbi:MAG: radical SAM protein, partial [bacterium]|nr:radical SAM protein [bacterium]
DDNFIGNIAHTKELLKALIPLKIRWASQGTLNMAQDDELLELLKESGCVLLLIGFESMDPYNLAQMNKKWMTKLGERDTLVQKIHDHGINIYATFVFGYDNDTPDTFKMAVDFSMKHRLFFAAFNHLLPWPGTPLYQRLEKENKLVLPKWWLEESAKYGDYFFSTERMSHEELRDGCHSARREFFLYSNIFKRGMKLFKRNPQLLMFYLFFTQNTLLRREIEKRMRLPLGTGLDTMPK